MPSPIVSSRRAPRSATAAPRRHASFNTQMTAPIVTNSTSPMTSLGSAMAHEYAGGSHRYCAEAAQMTVVTSPGQNPPSHALSATAGNIVMNGSLIPHAGSKLSRMPTAATAAPTATAYRLIGESVIRRRNSPRAVVMPRTPGGAAAKGAFLLQPTGNRGIFAGQPAGEFNALLGRNC